jgi:hypothetical protein
LVVVGIVETIELRRQTRNRMQNKKSDTMNEQQCLEISVSTGFVIKKYKKREKTKKPLLVSKDPLL